MVMAGNENGAGPALADDPLGSRLQWLQQRRQALQEKLIIKNNELKNLCIDEAELTGILPPEIPLEPGESPPSFRRRVGTAFTYPQNLINKLKTTEAEESALELERQVQVNAAEAALRKFNDPVESKAVRRKNRLLYQQSQRRLQELDSRLSFIRHGHGKVGRISQPTHSHNTLNYGTQPSLQGGHGKHRSKKPRPPLEGNDRPSKSSRGLLQEGGVSLSPLGQDQNYNTYPGTGYHEVDSPQTPLAPIYNQNRTLAQRHPSPTTRQQQSPKLLVSSDFNDNHNVYILPDQYRARTYSHGSGGSRNNPSSLYLDTERSYRPVPNTYTEQERLLRYRPHQQQLLLQNHQQYPEYKATDTETARYQIPHQAQFYHESDPGVRRYAHTPDYQIALKSQQTLQRREQREAVNPARVSSRVAGPPTDPHQPPGYWVRYEDEIVWCPDQDPAVDKFGSLDRRKRGVLQHANATGGGQADQQTRYHTVAGSKSTSILPRHNVPLNPPQLEQSHCQTAPSRLLLRTQSLGSVETWHSGQSQESQDKDSADGSCVKEKGWYETALDSGPGGLTPKKIVRGLVGQGISYAGKEIGAEDSQPKRGQQNLNRYHQPPKILEIPAESKLLDNNNERGGLESPNKNCTVVQAGKYQPYREVTKPFEMSDFYKYSTKYKKRNENVYSQAQSPVGLAAGVANKLPQDPRVNMMIQMSQELRLDNVDDRSVPSPVQKRIYQPLQRMTCQPYNALRAEEGGEEWYVSEKEAASSATLV